MSQLPTSNIKGITLSQCGLVFLATPHTGTTKADWSNFIVAAAGTVAGVRPEVVSYLQSFNPASVWDKKAFLKLSPRPPFRCFAEGRKKLIKGTYQHVSFLLSLIPLLTPGRLSHKPRHLWTLRILPSCFYTRITVQSASLAQNLELTTPLAPL